MGGEIYAALAAIAGEVGAVSKDRQNKQQGYRFRGIDDMYDALHALLAKHGVTCVPEVVDIQRDERPSKSGGVLITTIAKIAYTFYAKDGSSVRAVTIGEGMDSGDKSANKAMAGAQKYALVQVFTIPTGENVDSEHDDPEPAPKAKPVEKPKSEAEKAYDENYERLAALLNAKLFTKEECTAWRMKMDKAVKGDKPVDTLIAIRVDIETAATKAKDDKQIGEVV